MARIAIRLIIRGYVQGVGYRWWARGEARRLGVDGWVGNRSDGTVELIAAGPPAAVQQFEAACRRGPAAARVVAVERSAADDPGAAGFESR